MERVAGLLHHGCLSCYLDCRCTEGQSRQRSCDTIHLRTGFRPADDLEAKGYDIGKVDGKIGAGTRAAVKDQQINLGLPANSYPDLALLQKLGG
jgi:Putative peptidoglycan binding domain